MQQIISGLRRSASIKTATIGFLILLLLIPVSMIRGVVEDRSQVLFEARNDIMRSWGGEQILSGPILVVPYTRSYENRHGDVIVEDKFVYVLPTNLDVSGSLATEIRYRGAHEVPVYRAMLNVSGRFDRPDMTTLDSHIDAIDWASAYVALFVSEARAITATPSIDVGAASATFRPGGAIILTDMPAPIVADIGNPFTEGSDTAEFRTTLSINGTDTLKLMALGDTTNLQLESEWSSPSFTGNYLPTNHSISDAGFSANWQVSSLGRALPSRWTSSNAYAVNPHHASFGVSLYMPVSLYQLMFRAVRYAILFIALTFVAYFLFEILAKLRLHPLQYLLVGFANAMFFLLLLSLAEHIGFGWAYLASALASSGLVGGYSGTVLGDRSRGLIMVGILFGLYGFLYMTLNAETYALLAGAIALWITLAIIMYLTRRIDWYGRSDETSNTPL